jgi:hypothetical protein
VSRELLRHVVLPVLFLTAALLGGLRFVGAESELRFTPPPLVALPLALFLVALFARARLLALDDWLGERRPPLENASNALTLAALYAATVQVFSAVIPEDTLFNAVFTLFFAAVIWNNFFVLVRPDRLLKSLGGLLLAAFAVKYVLLVGLNEPAGTVTGAVARALLRGVTLGGLDSEPYTRASGYTAFAAVALYLAGLWASSPPRDERADLLYDALLRRGSLTAVEGRRLLAALAPAEEDAVDAELEEERRR